MEKRLAIIGAGISGLLSCKYALEKGFDPVVFEAAEGIGGIWTRTIASTKLQDSIEGYRFSDFPWPPSADTYPSHNQVVDYLGSYAEHFGLFPYINFNSKVIGIDYIGESYEEIESWSLWGGTGGPFGSKGKWHIEVQDVKSTKIQEYEVEFVILCIGLYGGFPHIPSFPPNQGPEVFNGKVVTALDYSEMDDSGAVSFIKGKRVAIVGSQKSAVDIAAECADVNGPDYPCTLIQRSVHWFLPSENIGALKYLPYLVWNRFAELMVHKPGESYLLSLLATLLLPLRWAISKFVELNIRSKLPLKKHGMLPKQSFYQDFFGCNINVLPEKFYNKVEEGSIVLKNSQSFSFCEEGLIIDRESHMLEADVVIFATGYNSCQKLRNIFKSPFFQKRIAGTSSGVPSFYRDVIHPRIPQLAVLGYAESFSSLYAIEVRCQWLAHFLDGGFKLPCISEMEKDIMTWEIFGKKCTKGMRKITCINNIQTWYNDQLLKEMGCNPRRKKGFFKDLLVPYAPPDYAGLTAKQGI